MKRNLTIFFTAFALLLLAAFVIHNRSTRAALQRYEAELRSKGEKLTYAELAIAPSTNADEVASRQILATNGNLSAGPLPDVMRLVAPGKARVAWRAGVLENRDTTANGRPVTNIFTWAELDATNQASAAALEIRKTALLHPTPDTGWVYQDTFQNLTNGPPRTFTRDRFLAQALWRAIIGELHHGNLDATRSDLHALINLCQLDRNELTLVHPFINILVAELTVPLTWEALQSPGWNDAQLAEIQHAWENVDLIAGLERGFEGMRAVGRILIAQARIAKRREFADLMITRPRLNKSKSNSAARFLDAAWTDNLLPIVYKTSFVDQDALLRLKSVTEDINAIRMIQAGHPWSEVGPLQLAMETNLNVILTRPFGGSCLFVTGLLPNYSFNLKRAVQTETLRRLTITALAIKRYELVHNVLPPSFQALVPDFLPAIPRDPMNAKDLSYHLKPDAGYLLYSVGEDGVDNGGQGGLEMWTGPDTVWPEAEK